MNFCSDVFYAQLVKGKLTEAMTYLSRIPGESDRHNKYVELFEKENYLKMADDPFLDKILMCYQRYYRDVFYLKFNHQTAAEKLRAGLAELLGRCSLDELEEEAKSAFESRGYSFLGGRTGGFYGPYVWKTIEKAEFDLELPEGTYSYHLHFLDGFISKSWLDYISFGEVSTGGWADGNGVINCIKSSYDVNSENFRVSLLKHEAQHELDLRRYPGISSAELEYRGKLVELIYSQERELLRQFVLEADDTDENSAHCVAAQWIKCSIPADYEISHVQTIAAELFRESCQKMKTKYGTIGK